MIIENVDALKSWLAKLLEPICDADPSALANYVVALVKKDKPEKDLRALCADQLDVFLQKDARGRSLLGRSATLRLFESVNKFGDGDGVVCEVLAVFPLKVHRNLATASRSSRENDLSTFFFSQRHF
ncbi:hypothetical protein PGIGA_G00060350 [Pangasianodon gigas]|uniref:Uncharacterized protein n=1 Tax=Pangasianodon gigas TaxID=30993 RepID=A0ACC5X5R0_PANGG|nr:hypothetical protein [Pangasianodon gigas]